MSEIIEIDGLTLSDSEKDCIVELRNRMKNYVNTKMYEDLYLFYRFLKAEEFNTDQAEKNLKEALEYWKQMQVDNILTEYDPPEVLKKFLSNTRFGFAKDGSVVHYIACGKMDPKGLSKSCRDIDMQKKSLQIIEQDEEILLRKRKTKNGPYPGYIYIYDSDGLTFANATDKKAIENFIRVLKIYEKYYPERLKAVYVINVFSYFAITFSLVKVLLSATTLGKLHILGENWKEVLLDVIDADQLPAFMGGTRTDPDGNPLCKTFLHQGGKVDESYYIDKSKKSLVNSPGIQKLTLARASFSEIFVEIKEACSLIEWEFETKTKDIGFGLFLKEIVDGEEKITELVPLLRLETDDYFEVGVYKCEKAGTYIILFDNSYSWLRSKEVYYRTTVVSPDEVEKRLQSL